MGKAGSEDEVWIVGLFKREFSSFKSSWKSFTEDMVKREYVKQFEASGVKTEANAVVGAANLVNAEATWLKLEKTLWDPLGDLEKAKEKEKEEQELRSNNLHPTQLQEAINTAKRDLRQDISRVRGEAGQARNKAEEAKRAVTSIRRQTARDLQGIADEFERVETRINGLGQAL
ncbi:hypothetical protein ABT112_11110 [Streptomyces sp. NPDC002055]|uniref:hypothetical protein n=1 Tax=Streptomyces sp. NPDC002055 TaxID=3154534 RepID=UPI00333396C7